MRSNTIVKLNYEGWCRRIDLLFRAKYPYLKTRLFKINDNLYEIFVQETLSDFTTISDDFDHAIRYVTAPISITRQLPKQFKSELPPIPDNQIPCGFEGLPLTHYQLTDHILANHPNIQLCSITEDHANRTILVHLHNSSESTDIDSLKVTLDKLRYPYSFCIALDRAEPIDLKMSDEVARIQPSKALRKLNCPFLERDEQIWFGNLESIYNGDMHKSDLYFFDSRRKSCLVDFSRFRNANLRNHILLYDVVYCIFPLATEMGEFLVNQKLSREDLLFLASKGRVVVLNMQPETRMDHAFLNEIYATNPGAVASRRAISALCAIDLVDTNREYILNASDIQNHLPAFLSEMSTIVNRPVEEVANLLLWPRQALRNSFIALNNGGPMSISNYGVNKPILQALPHQDSNALEFEFTIHSDIIHVAHALDATYFPFHTADSAYTDYPYALTMGNLLNFYRNYSLDRIHEAMAIKSIREGGSRTLDLIDTFEVNDYLSLEEFEEVIASPVLRKGLRSLFDELSALEMDERRYRIDSYNQDVRKELKKRAWARHSLDLGEDTVGLVLPFLATGKKVITAGAKKAIDKFPGLQEVSAFIEDRTLPRDSKKRNASILTQINRVARLRRDICG